MADDDDPGSTHLKNVFTEGQDKPNNATLSGSYGSLADTGNDQLRSRITRNRGDSYYEERYGKSTDLSDGDQIVNRSRKGNRR